MTKIIAQEGSIAAKTIVNCDIQLGYSKEEYKADLENREREVTERLNVEHALKTDLLHKDLKIAEFEKLSLKEEKHEIQKRLASVEKSYKTYVGELEKRIRDLENFRGSVSDDLLNQAKIALSHGDKSHADRLYVTIQEESIKPILLAAEASYQRGKIAEEDLQFKNAYEQFQKAIQLSPDNPTYLSSAGKLASKIGQYNSAISYYEKTLEIYKSNSESDMTAIADTKNNLAMVWNALANYDKAIELLQDALADDLERLPLSHPTIAIRHNNIGLTWYSLGQYNKAITHLELALKSNLENYGAHDPEVAVQWNNLGLSWAALGRYEKASKLLEQALHSDLKSYKNHNPTVATDQSNLGLVMKHMGEYEKSIEYYELALESDSKYFGFDHPTVANDHNNLGMMWKEYGDYEKAKTHLELALSSDLKTFGENHPIVKKEKEYLRQVNSILNRKGNISEFAKMTRSLH
ncbi:MAG: tetratricopeptide repeat protein [Gammaproteobacteria bacterium]|nr:tetratricopeptide repeat protein [Gammaproteobacteria bacterium]